MSSMVGIRVVVWADEWIDAEVGGWVGGCVSALMGDVWEGKGQTNGGSV